MSRAALPLLLVLAAGLPAQVEDTGIVFRSDVSLVRIDAQVVDRGNRAITGLEAKDFVLLDGGQEREIRNFGSEDMPVDVLFLVDVSGSMQSHVQRLADASSDALRVLGPDDRVAVMVFDRSTRVHLPFTRNGDTVSRAMAQILNRESFDGGTDINRGLSDAATYVGRNARREARRAIVILTDDQTERSRDPQAMARTMLNSDIVLSALLAPDAVGANRSVVFGGGGGGGWPSDPLGGIIFGRRGPLGRRMPGPVIQRPGTQSAGTAEIARQSGGDSLSIDEGSAVETTLTRIRQRYALHFTVPEAVRAGEDRNVEIRLTNEARRRYPHAEVRYRGNYQAPRDLPQQREAEVLADASPAPSAGEPEPRRGGWRRVDEPAPPAAEPAPAPREEEPRKGGWRRIDPNERP